MRLVKQDKRVGRLIRGKTRNRNRPPVIHPHLTFSFAAATNFRLEAKAE